MIEILKLEEERFWRQFSNFLCISLYVKNLEIKI